MDDEDKRKLKFIFSVMHIEQVYQIAREVEVLKQKGFGSITLRIKDHLLRFIDVETSKQLSGRNE